MLVIGFSTSHFSNQRHNAGAALRHMRDVHVHDSGKYCEEHAAGDEDDRAAVLPRDEGSDGHVHRGAQSHEEHIGANESTEPLHGTGGVRGRHQSRSQQDLQGCHLIFQVDGNLGLYSGTGAAE